MIESTKVRNAAALGLYKRDKIVAYPVSLSLLFAQMQQHPEINYPQLAE
jgi:hypothetical protein